MFNFAQWIVSGAIAVAPMAAMTAQTDLNDAPQRIEAPLAFNATEALSKANAALNAITTAEGRFSQYDANGQYSQGKFYISRPGKLRFEYDDPMPVTLVADGTTLAIEDRDLETIDRVPLASTPLNLLLRKNTDLAAHANILAIEQKGSMVSVRVNDRSGESEGELELFFDHTTYQLKKWEVVDSFGQRTTVDLISIKEGGKISPRVFRLDDPEDEDERRR